MEKIIGGGRVGEDVSYCLDSNYHKGTNNATKGRRQLIAAQRGRDNGQELEIREDGISNSLTSVQKDNYVITHNLQPRTSKTGKGGTGHLSKADNTPYCLDTGNNQAIEILQTDYTKGNSQGNRVYDTSGVSVCLSSQSRGQGGKTGLYEVNKTIRRLTPIECERLQSLPDNWTKYGNYAGKIKEVSDTQRYKMCGNAVTKDVIKSLVKIFPF